MEPTASIKSTSTPSKRIPTAPVRVSEDEVRSAALLSVLTDFGRQAAYRAHKDQLRRAGRDVHIIPVRNLTGGKGRLGASGSGTEGNSSSPALVHHQPSVIFKDHRSAAGSLFFYQASLFGLTAVATCSTALALFFAVTKNRMLLPVAAGGAVVSVTLWRALETAWDEKRYADQAAAIREERKGNPMLNVSKRRRKEILETAAEEGEHSSPVIV